MDKEEKKKDIDNFLSHLKDFVSSKAQDIVDSANADCWDSMVGMGSFASEEKLGKSLYKLFDIDINSSIGEAGGYANIQDRILHLDLNMTKEVAMLKPLLKKDENGWYYETAF